MSQLPPFSRLQGQKLLQPIGRIEHHLLIPSHESGMARQVQMVTAGAAGSNLASHTAGQAELAQSDPGCAQEGHVTEAAHPGMVRAASPAMRFQSALSLGTLPSSAPVGSGSSASGRVCRTPPSVTLSGPSATSLPSRSFQMSSSSLEGAVPISPAQPEEKASGVLNQVSWNMRRQGVNGCI